MSIYYWCTHLRYWARAVGYGTGLYRLASRNKPAHATQADWDASLSSGLVSYLGDSLSIDTRNAITAMLLRHGAPANTAVLDLGCAAGTLADVVLPAGVSAYVGVDISAVAVAAAARHPRVAPWIAAGRARFVTSDLGGFAPEPGERYGAVVFNEVLYYLSPDEAVRTVDRLADCLVPGGVLIVSMKDDAKAHLVFRLLKGHFIWRGGLLWQETDRPRFRVRINRECPGYLTGMLAPRQAAAERKTGGCGVDDGHGVLAG